MMDGVYVISYIMLWALTLILVIVVLGLLNAVTTLRQRLGPEPGALAINDGPLIGSQAPRLEGTLLSGVHIGRAASDHTTVLVFVSPTCDPCLRLLPQISGFVRRTPEVDLFVILQGSAKSARELVSLYEIPANVLVDTDGTITAAFGVRATPFGLAIDTDWIVRTKGIANDAGHLEALARFNVTPQGHRSFTTAEPADTAAK
jgi:methylamine dehydrogenase accessory protein MauD